MAALFVRLRRLVGPRTCSRIAHHPARGVEGRKTLETRWKSASAGVANLPWWKAHSEAAMAPTLRVPVGCCRAWSGRGCGSSGPHSGPRRRPSSATTPSFRGLKTRKRDPATRDKGEGPCNPRRATRLYVLLVLVLSARDVPLGHRLEADVVLTAMEVPVGHLRETEPVLTARDVPLGHRCARLLGRRLRCCGGI